MGRTSEYKSAGIYVKEVPPAVKSEKAFSASSMAIVGQTKKGPSNTPEAHESLQEWIERWGISYDSYVAMNVAAYFKNDGTKVWTIRVTPGDAVKAKAYMEIETTQTEHGNETNGVLKDFLGILSSTPVVPGEIIVTYVSNGVNYNLVDNGLGVFSGDGVGLINYTTGGYALTLSEAPTAASVISFSYKRSAWYLELLGEGVYGNDMKFIVLGNELYWNKTTGTWDKYDLAIYDKDDTGVYQLVEYWEAIQFSDDTAIDYFESVINDADNGSDYCRVVNITGGLSSVFSGVTSVQSIVVGGNNVGSITTTLTGVPIGAGTITVAGTDNNSNVIALTDRGDGIIIEEDEDSVGTINYVTGEISISLSGRTFKAGTNVTFSYFQSSTSSMEKNFINGSDGDGTIGRDDVSNPNLEEDYKGIYALKKVSEVVLLSVPDFSGNKTVARDCKTFAEARGNIFVILATGAAKTVQEAKDYARFILGVDSSFAALYYPWIRSKRLDGKAIMTIPPIGHVAGVYARTEQNKHPGKAPAGISDGALVFVESLERELTRAELDIIYPWKVNPLINFPETGLCVWGARTLSNDPLWKYINARRVVMSMRWILFNKTQWVVMEDNGPNLWAKISTFCKSILMEKYEKGWFAGTTAGDAFFFICDSSNNNQDTIDAGEVIMDVGVAPTKPAEFGIIRITQHVKS